MMDVENGKSVKLFNKIKSDVCDELNAFRKKSKVSNLTLYKCELFLFDIDLLNRFEKLIKLTLNNNFIISVKEGVFNKLMHLKVIDLSHNCIVNIEDHVFAYNLNLIDIDLSYNTLTDIKPSFFSNLHNLEHLDLSHNKIKDLLSYFLDNKSLKRLKLGHNLIYSISDLAFHKVPNLDYLELNHNHVPAIHSKLFAETLLLSQLLLNDNLIVYISKRAFLNLDNLKHVQLEDNLIICIDDLFEKNINLKSLDFGNNDIRLINRNVFQNNGNLTYLRLVVVEKFDAYSIYHLTNLQLFELVYEIDMKSPILMALIAVLLNKPKLIILRIIYKHSYNYASLVRFNGLTSLEKLHIECLNVDEKLLKINICSQLKRMRNLRYLTLKNVNLLNIPFENEIKMNLQHLNLSGLKNTFIDDMFNDFPLLEELILSFSDISIFDENAFESLTRLKLLNLEHCKMRYICSNLFHNNSNLKTINLSYNCIETIFGFAFTNLRSLESLDLRGNRILNISPEAFSSLGNSTQILLGDL